ncbi:hypothetical protein SprV_0501931800 [Sparganum proliferum]
MTQFFSHRADGVPEATRLMRERSALKMTELKNSNFNIVFGPSPSRAIISDTRSSPVHSNSPSPWTTKLDYNVSAVVQPSPTSSEQTSFTQQIKSPTIQEKQPSVGVAEAYLELEKHFQLNPIHFAKWWKAGVPEKSRLGAADSPKPTTPTLPDTTVSRRGILKGEKLQQQQHQQQQIQSPFPSSPAQPELNAYYVRDSLDLPTYTGKGSFDSYSSSGQESCLSETCGSLSRKTVRFAADDDNLNHHVLQQQQQQSPNILRIDPSPLGASGSEDSTCTLIHSPSHVQKSPTTVDQSYAENSSGLTVRPATRRGAPGIADPYELEDTQPTPAQPLPRFLRPVTTQPVEAKPPRPPKLIRDPHQQRARRMTTDVAELRSASGGGYLRLHDQRRHQRGATLDSSPFATASRAREQGRTWDEVDSAVPLNDESYANAESFHLAYQSNGWFRREADVPTPASAAADSESVSVRTDSLLSSNRRRPYRPPRVERIDSLRLDDIARQLTSPTLLLDTPSFSHLTSERTVSPVFRDSTNGASSPPTVPTVDGNHCSPAAPKSDNLKSQHNGFLEFGQGGRFNQQVSPNAHFLRSFQPRQPEPLGQTPAAEPTIRIVPVKVMQDCPASRTANTVVTAPADSTEFPKPIRPKLLPRRGSLTRGRPQVGPPQPLPRVRKGNLADSGWPSLSIPSPTVPSRRNGQQAVVLPSLHTPVNIPPEHPTSSGRAAVGTARGGSADARRPTGRLDRDGVWRPIGDSGEGRSRGLTGVLPYPRRTFSPPPRSPYDSLDLFLAHERELQSPVSVPPSLTGGRSPDSKGSLLSQTEVRKAPSPRRP